METANNFRGKVFDESVMDFCVSLLDLVDKMPAQSPLLKRVVLDSLTVSSSLPEVSVFMKSLNTLPLHAFMPSMEAFLDSCDKLSKEKIDLSDFLMTIRHLGAVPGYRNWPEFFKGMSLLGADEKLVTEYLMTVRHLAALPTFSYWDELLKCLGIWAEDAKASEELLMTVRHLAAVNSFGEWEAFFGALKILGENKPSALGEVAMAVRHAIEYFRTADSLKGLFRTLANAPQFAEAFSFGQLDSKKWLIAEAPAVWGYDWGTVFVLAGWIGVLPRFIFEAGITVKNVRSFDLDPSVGPVSELLNQAQVQSDWLYKSSTMDITQMKYPTTYNVQRKDSTLCELYEMPNVVINTSCEHLADIEAWWAQIPKGTRVILQSNDGFHIPEHVKCFKSLQDFENAMNLSKLEYRGEKALADFNRFMLIGEK